MLEFFTFFYIVLSLCAFVFQRIQYLVNEDTRTRVEVKLDDFLAAVNVKGYFYRALILSPLQSNELVHIELRDYGERLLVEQGQLYGLTRAVAAMESPTLFCHLNGSSTEDDYEEWDLTASRLASLQGDVVVFAAKGAGKKGDKRVRIWDSHGEEVSRERRQTVVEERVRVRDVPYASPVCVGDVITVQPISFNELDRVLVIAPDAKLLEGML